MRRFGTRDELLEEAGYHFNFERALYVNRQTKKAFSIEFVEDHTDEEIRERIDRGGSDGTWSFYFNSDPSDSVRRELERVLS